MNGPSTPGAPCVRGIYKGLGTHRKPATQPSDLTSVLPCWTSQWGRPMFLDLQAEVGVKVFIGEMAVGFVGWRFCCTGACMGPRTRLSAPEALAWPC